MLQVLQTCNLNATMLADKPQCTARLVCSFGLYAALELTPSTSPNATGVLTG